MKDYLTLSRPLPMVPTVILLALLLGLGVWQISLAERAVALNRAWRAQASAPPMEDLPPPAESGLVRNRKMKLMGRFRHGESIRLPEKSGGREGVELITPFVLMGGARVLVDRGFVARDTHEAADLPIGAVFVEGEMRPIPPALAEAMAKKKEGTEKSYPLMLVAGARPVNTAWPRPRKPEPPYANPHGYYAMIFVLLALALGLLYFFSQAKAKED